jgi:hypothetical protein
MSDDDNIMISSKRPLSLVHIELDQDYTHRTELRRQP